MEVELAAVIRAFKKRNSATLLRTVTFGCVPVEDSPETRADLLDLCGALSEAFGLEVRPHRAPSPAALASAFRHGRVHLAWTSPTLVAGHPAFVDALPLARTVRGGRSWYRAALFVRADSAIHAPSQLRGAQVAWVGPASASGYLFPRQALRAAGLVPEELFCLETELGSHGAVRHAVRSGIVDVGATFAHPSGAVGEVPSAGDAVVPSDEGFRVILLSDAIPSDLIVAAPALVATLGAEAPQVLERLDRDPVASRALARLLGAEGFERCADGELTAVKRSLDPALAVG